MMKGAPFLSRVGFALSGFVAALRHEASFRIQILFAFVTVAVTCWVNPPLVWTALVMAMIALVLAAELFNTALEHLLDGLHPESAEFVRLAKDCAAAAVVVLSLAAVVVFVMMLAQFLSLP